MLVATPTAFTEIPINRASVYGAQLLNACSQLQQAINGLNVLAAKANTMVVNNNNGTNNYNQIEVQFGLTATGTDVTSTGYSLQYQINAVNTILANATISQFLAQVG